MESNDIQKLVDSLEPYGHFEVVDNNTISGNIDYRINEKLLFSYRLSLDLRPISKKSIPSVRETEGKIPISSEYHIYPSGDFCMCHPDEKYFYYTKYKSNWYLFFENLVVPFLCACTYKDLYGVWKSDEYPHDRALANFILFRNYLGIEFHSFNEFVISKNMLLRNSRKCYCQSGILRDECHKIEYEKFTALFKDKKSMRDFIEKVEFHSISDF